MNPHEWALVIFTVVMQMAVGAFVILGGVHFFASRRAGPDQANILSDRALIAIGPAVVLALIVTLFHLGNPLNAPRAILNVGSSWLSREIVLSLAFSVLGAAFAFMQWRKIGSATLRNGLALVNAAVGLVLVYAMSMVYRIPSVPVWNTPVTTLTFFITTFLLGSLAMGAAFVANYWYLRRQDSAAKDVQYTMLATSLRWIALIAIVLLGVQLVILPLSIGQMSADTSLSTMTQQPGSILILRLVLLFFGAGLFAAFIYAMAASESRVRVMGNIAYLAFALVLVSEILGRYLFYASMVRIGI